LYKYYVGTIVSFFFSLFPNESPNTRSSLGMAVEGGESRIKRYTRRVARWKMTLYIAHACYTDGRTGAYEHTYYYYLFSLYLSNVFFGGGDAISVDYPPQFGSGTAAVAVIVVTAAAAVSTVNEQSHPSRSGCWHTHTHTHTRWLSSIYIYMTMCLCGCEWVGEGVCDVSDRGGTNSRFVAIQNCWKHNKIVLFYEKQHRRVSYRCT